MRLRNSARAPPIPYRSALLSRAPPLGVAAAATARLSPRGCFEGAAALLSGAGVKPEGGRAAGGGGRRRRRAARGDSSLWKIRHARRALPRRRSSIGRRPPAPPARSELPARPRHRKFSRAHGLRKAERARLGGDRRAGPPSAWCRAPGPRVRRTRGGAGLSPAPEPLSSCARSRLPLGLLRGSRSTPCPGCCRCWGAGRRAA